MKLETAGVHTGKKILAQPGNHKRQRSQTRCDETQQKYAPVMKNIFQNSVIAATKPLKPAFKTLLPPD